MVDGSTHSFDYCSYVRSIIKRVFSVCVCVQFGPCRIFYLLNKCERERTTKKNLTKRAAKLNLSNLHTHAKSIKKTIKHRFTEEQNREKKQQLYF